MAIRRTADYSCNPTIDGQRERDNDRDEERGRKIMDKRRAEMARLAHLTPVTVTRTATTVATARVRPGVDLS